MKTATDNGGNLINKLQLVYNKAVGQYFPGTRESSTGPPQFNGKGYQRFERI
ncbi:hypothetical protein ACLK19_25130 [Escherichia coli]